LKQVPQKLVVIGAGVIGVELVCGCWFLTTNLLYVSHSAYR